MNPTGGFAGATPGSRPGTIYPVILERLFEEVFG